MRRSIFSISVAVALAACGGSEVASPESGYEFVRDTFVDVNVKESIASLSFDGGDYDLLLLTLPLKVYFNGVYLTVRDPFIFVNPSDEVGVVQAEDIYQAALPDSFSRDTFLRALPVWDSTLDGKMLYFKLFGEMDSVLVVSITPDSLVLEKGGAIYVIRDYADAYLNLGTMELVSPTGLYDSTYHIRFEGTTPYLNIYYDWGVSVSTTAPYDTTIITPYGNVLHENHDGDSLYTDEYVSAIGSGWYTVNENHMVIPDDLVFFVKKPDGSIYAFEVLDYYNQNGESGYFTIRFGKLKQ